MTTLDQIAKAAYEVGSEADLERMYTWAMDVRTRPRHPSDPPAKPNDDNPGIVKLRSREKLTLLYIAYEYEFLDSFPSYEELSAGTGFSVRTVKKHVKILRFAGLLDDPDDLR